MSQKSINRKTNKIKKIVHKQNKNINKKGNCQKEPYSNFGAKEYNHWIEQSHKNISKEYSSKQKKELTNWRQVICKYKVRKGKKRNKEK